VSFCGTGLAYAEYVEGKSSGSLAAALLLVLAACGGGSTTPTPTPGPGPTPNVNACGAIAQTVSSLTAITNGTQCSADNTSVVRLIMRGAAGNEGSCSGTIVAPRVVLTAAHCLDDGVRTVLVWGGVGEPIEASSFKAHPNYNQSSSVVSFDAGLVFMNQDLGRPAVPVLLSRDGQRGETAVVAGWGRDQQSVSAFLRAGTTTLSDVRSDRLETQFSTMTTGICAGDSGGPILLSEGGVWSIGGIISATSASTCNTGEHFYAPVRNGAIRSFIVDNVENWTQR
jgi:V8-like Glu-specific endopeptidase